MTDITNNFHIRTTDMPKEMRVLLEQYPRACWEAHEGFSNKTRQWLNAHQMFRRLSKLVRTDAEALLDQSMDPQNYATRLSRFGNMLVRNLHGHHAWEDHEYFPELSAADTRFDRGLDILEKDHEELNKVLDVFTDIGNRILKLEKLEENKMHDEVGKLHLPVKAIEAFLGRHLGDEEDLAVPMILHHRLRG